jgi:hypothetical protein
VQPAGHIDGKMKAYCRTGLLCIVAVFHAFLTGCGSISDEVYHDMVRTSEAYRGADVLVAKSAVEGFLRRIEDYRKPALTHDAFDYDQLSGMQWRKFGQSPELLMLQKRLMLCRKRSRILIEK